MPRKWWSRISRSPGDEDVVRKVAGDLDGKGVGAPDVRREMERLMQVAAEQVENEG